MKALSEIRAAVESAFSSSLPPFELCPPETGHEYALPLHALRDRSPEARLTKALAAKDELLRDRELARGYLNFTLSDRAWLDFAWAIEVPAAFRVPGAPRQERGRKALQGWPHAAFRAAGAGMAALSCGDPPPVFDAPPLPGEWLNAAVAWCRTWTVMHAEDEAEQAARLAEAVLRFCLLARGGDGPVPGPEGVFSGKEHGALRLFATRYKLACISRKFGTPQVRSGEAGAPGGAERGLLMGWERLLAAWRHCGPEGMPGPAVKALAAFARTVEGFLARVALREGGAEDRFRLYLAGVSGQMIDVMLRSLGIVPPGRM